MAPVSGGGIVVSYCYAAERACSVQKSKQNPQPRPGLVDETCVTSDKAAWFLY